jgi:hypothetical protein
MGVNARGRSGWPFELNSGGDKRSRHAKPEDLVNALRPSHARQCSYEKRLTKMSGDTVRGHTGHVIMQKR